MSGAGGESFTPINFLGRCRNFEGPIAPYEPAFPLPLPGLGTLTVALPEEVVEMTEVREAGPQGYFRYVEVGGEEELLRVV